MGNLSSKFRKHLIAGDEYAALQLYHSSPELRRTLDPNISYGESYQHNTPLHYVCKYGMKPLVRILLKDLSGNPNKKNAYNETSLHCLCKVPNIHSPSVQMRRADALAILLQWRGAQLSNGEVEKADLSAVDEKKNTPLHYAALSGLKPCVELLVVHGAPLFAENGNKETPCDCAEKWCHNEIAIFLESKMVFSNDNMDGVNEADLLVAETQEVYSGLKAQDLQEAKDQLIVETSDMLHVPLFTAEALLRNHEWSRESLLEAWMHDPFGCCEKCGVQPPTNILEEKRIDGHIGPIKDSYHEEETLNSPVKTSPVSANTVCDICACNITICEEPVPMSCEHQFCRSCWQSYLHVKIQDGDAHNIMCPAYQCTKLVPVDIIEKLVTREMAMRYLQFDIKAFVESNPSIKWCPYPGCGRAVKLPESETSPPPPLNLPNISPPPPTSHAVDCGNGHFFCWECLGEAHEPSSCDNWTEWHQKISEVKPEELTGTGEETEDAANCLWLVTNSKPCPNCKSPIQKNEGCNHMKCSKCKFDFCWVCLESWKRHSSATGGYFRCNRYDAVHKAEERSGSLISLAEERNKKMQELNRFVHYYTRFKNHENSHKLEEPLLATAKEKMRILAKANQPTALAETEIKFIEDAIHELLKARQVLRASYVYGYYLEDNGYNKTIFEFMQNELEECTETLSQMVARPYLRTSRAKIIQTAKLVKRKRFEFVTAVAKGLIPPETPPNMRKFRKRRFPGLLGMDLEDEDLTKAIAASLRDLDPNNPWVKDNRGRHTNLAAIYDWPDYDSDDDLDTSTALAASILGTCVRSGCNKPRARNPRTGAIHDHCSLKCSRLDRLGQSDSCSSSPSFTTDFSTELMLALEMSRLQLLQDISNLNNSENNQRHENEETPSLSESIFETPRPQMHGPNLFVPDSPQSDEANQSNSDELQLSESQSAPDLSDEDTALKLAIHLSLKDIDTCQHPSTLSDLEDQLEDLLSSISPASCATPNLHVDSLEQLIKEQEICTKNFTVPSPGEDIKSNKQLFNFGKPGPSNAIKEVADYFNFDPPFDDNNSNEQETFHQTLNVGSLSQETELAQPLDSEIQQPAEHLLIDSEDIQINENAIGEDNADSSDGMRLLDQDAAVKIEENILSRGILCLNNENYAHSEIDESGSAVTGASNIVNSFASDISEDNNSWHFV